jgi:hypothetical protein
LNTLCLKISFNEWDYVFFILIRDFVLGFLDLIGLCFEWHFLELGVILNHLPTLLGNVLYFLVLDQLHKVFAGKIMEDVLWLFVFHHAKLVQQILDEVWLLGSLLVLQVLIYKFVFIIGVFMNLLGHTATGHWGFCFAVDIVL